jgi:hypothetical protein
MNGNVLHCRACDLRVALEADISALAAARVASTFKLRPEFEPGDDVFETAMSPRLVWKALQA